MTKLWKVAIVVALIAAVAAVFATKDRTGEPKVARPTAAGRDLPRMIEIGADKCANCKMMKPVLAALEKNYAGKLEVQFIDAWKDSRSVARYRVETIPTQILLDAAGREIFRHQGFFSEESIVEAFKRKGIDLNSGSDDE